MPLTSRTSNPSRILPRRFKKIEVSDVTGGTGAVAIPLIGTGEYRVDPVEFDTSLGRRQCAERHIIRFDVPDILAPNTGQLVNELVTKIIPYVKITFLDGSTVTIDSGDNNEPAFNFTKQLINEGEIVVWRVEGERYKSVEPMLNTTS